MSRFMARVKATYKLLASALKMYMLLRDMCTIQDRKARASSEHNDSAFMMELIAQEAAIDAARRLIARIDGTEVQE